MKPGISAHFWRSSLIFLAVFLSVLFLNFLKGGHAQAANPTTINFQGKVVDNTAGNVGINVPSTTYTIVFRIYDNSSPTIGANCNTNSQCWWEETQTGVSVTNGVFQVELGSVCAFTSACGSTHSGINFSTNNSLYLTMKFGSDTSFMTPVIHLTSVPYAYYSDNAGALGGVAAANFVQLAQAIQTDSSTSNASIGINKTGGTANIITIQRGGTPVFVLDTNGALALTPNGNNVGTVVRQTSGTATSGNIFDIQGANGTSHFIQVTQTAANAGAITISSLGSNNLTLQGGAAAILDAASGSTITLGNTGSGNYIQLAATTRELTFAGNARHTRYITLTAEYPGATLTGDGTNNTGTMTSDNTTANTSPGYMNYYDWTSTTSGNDYDIWIRVPLPEDWSAWSGSGGTVTAYGTAGTDDVTVAFYGTNDPASAICSGDAATSAGWNVNAATCNYTSGTFATSGGVFTVKITLRVNTANNHARVGDIKLPYLSRY